MGAGRKTYTYDGFSESGYNSPFEERQRNLGEDLGAVIFGKSLKEDTKYCSFLCLC